MVKTRSVKTGEKRGPGRPAMYETEEQKKAAAAMASWRYRHKIRMQKLARKSKKVPLVSKIVDLNTDISSVLASR